MKFIKQLTLFLTLATMNVLASAQTGSATIIVPAAAGGASDVLARVLAERIKGSLGHNVMVDNRGGGNGTIGVAAVVRASPDGRTMLISVDGPITTIPALMSGLSYDAKRDLMPAAVIGEGGDVVLAVPAESTAKDVRELVSQMRVDPAKSNYVSSGAGFTSHIMSELFKKEAKFDAQHIPVRGSGAAMTELMSGRYSFAFVPASLAASQSKGNKIRVLATASEHRNGLLPSVPTMAEAGFPGVTLPGYWIGLWVPAGTPAASVEKIAAAANAAVKTSEFSEILKQQGLVAAIATPAQIQTRIVKETQIWAKMISQLGIKLEQD